MADGKAELLELYRETRALRQERNTLHQARGQLEAYVEQLEFDAQEMRTKLDEAEKELLLYQESLHALRKDYTRVAGERDAQKVELSFLHARLEKAETRARRESSDSSMGHGSVNDHPPAKTETGSKRSSQGAHEDGELVSKKKRKHDTARLSSSSESSEAPSRVNETCKRCQKRNWTCKPRVTETGRACVACNASRVACSLVKKA